MAGITAVIIQIMPNSVEADLGKIKDDSRKALEAHGAMNISFEEVPIAFGLKILKAKFAWPEEKSTDIIENEVAKVKNVSSVTIEDYRRAFG